MQITNDEKAVLVTFYGLHLAFERGFLSSNPVTMSSKGVVEAEDALKNGMPSKFELIRTLAHMMNNSMLGGQQPLRNWVELIHSVLEEHIA